jgi:hypothetical protein
MAEGTEVRRCRPLSEVNRAAIERLELVTGIGESDQALSVLGHSWQHTWRFGPLLGRRRLRTRNGSHDDSLEAPDIRRAADRSILLPITAK